MAYTASSDQIAKLDASPVTKTTQLDASGYIRSVSAFFTGAVFDALTADQTAAIARIPARARLVGVFMTGVATGNTGSLDVGLYRTTANGGTAIDRDAFAAAVDENVTRNNLNLWVHTATADTGKNLKDLHATAVGTAGATNDVEYDIVASIVTVMGTPQAVSFRVDYVLPE
jgi:hypothetical protein